MSCQNVWRKIVAIVAVLGASIAGAKPPEGVLDATHANIRAVMAVQHEATPTLMNWDGVLGTAVGLDDNDQPSLVVYVDQESASMADVVRALPPQLRGVGVKVELTDKFRALVKPGRGGSRVSHTAKQTRPIQLGTSGGWHNDLANGYCCGGTLGSLIQVNGTQYILSNYHVFESDIFEGADGIVATTGDPIIQPGLIDVSCNAATAQNVATLVKLSSLPASNVDCSVAQVIPGMVRTDGSILEIGTLSTRTVAASLKKAVKKSGRTTGLTRSTISGLNATLSVEYDNECAGVAAFTKTFTGQIVIANRGSRFLAGGDSGSLMVENVAAKPCAIGLLYAGSSVSAIANPINDVLTFTGAMLGGTATMVGN
jgi:hypothetical protein